MTATSSGRTACKDNGQYGLSAYELDGVHDIVIDRNEIAAQQHRRLGARASTGAAAPAGPSSGTSTARSVTNNYVHDNLSVGLWADTNNRDFVVEGNWFEANQDEAFWYEISYNARIRYNTFVRNTLVKGQQYANAG